MKNEKNSLVPHLDTKRLFEDVQLFVARLAELVTASCAANLVQSVAYFTHALAAAMTDAKNVDLQRDLAA